MQIFNDHAVHNQHINLCINKTGDLVWWGSPLNIGNFAYLGIIIATEYSFEFVNSNYILHTINGIVSAEHVFPLEIYNGHIENSVYGAVYG